MYRGEINVQESDLYALLTTAKGLQIRGLTDAVAPGPTSSFNLPGKLTATNGIHTQIHFQASVTKASRQKRFTDTRNNVPMHLTTLK